MLFIDMLFRSENQSLLGNLHHAGHVCHLQAAVPFQCESEEIAQEIQHGAVGLLSEGVCNGAVVFVDQDYDLPAVIFFEGLREQEHGVP